VGLERGDRSWCAWHCMARQQCGKEAMTQHAVEELRGCRWAGPVRTILFYLFIFQMDSNFRWSKDDILLLEKIQIKYKIV
jgi:hypothetical protein